LRDSQLSAKSRAFPTCPEISPAKRQRHISEPGRWDETGHLGAHQWCLATDSDEMSDEKKRKKLVGASGPAWPAAWAWRSAVSELIPAVPSSVGQARGSVTSTEMICHQIAPCVRTSSSSMMWLWFSVGTITNVFAGTKPALANAGPRSSCVVCMVQVP